MEFEEVHDKIELVHRQGSRCIEVPHRPCAGQGGQVRVELGDGGRQHVPGVLERLAGFQDGCEAIEGPGVLPVMEPLGIHQVSGLDSERPRYDRLLRLERLSGIQQGVEHPAVEKALGVASDGTVGLDQITLAIGEGSDAVLEEGVDDSAREMLASHSGFPFESWYFGGSCP